VPTQTPPSEQNGQGHGANHHCTVWIIEWGGLQLTFRRGYTVDWIEPPTVGADGYPIASPGTPEFGPVTYTDAGSLARWNY
jgi:hypothetical protein